MPDLSIAVHVGPADHQRSWCLTFLDGLRAHGVKAYAVDLHATTDADVGVFWGARHQSLIEVYKCRSGAVILERGYIGNRMRYTSAGWNGLNGHADFCAAGADDSRWRSLGIELAPWRQGGEYILILGQVLGDASVLGVNLHQVYQGITSYLSGITVMPIRFRPHPLSSKQYHPDGAPTIVGRLDEALRGAAVAVTWNSNSATDAVLAGVPTITLDRGAVAWPVTSHDLDDIAAMPKPERRQWSHELAASQWDTQQMRAGETWAQLKGYLN